MKTLVWIFLVVLLFFGVLLVVTAEIVLYLTSNGHANLDFAIKNAKNNEHEMLRNERRKQDWEWLQQQNTKEYFIESSDGLMLRALYLPAGCGTGVQKESTNPERLAFCIHGIQSNGTREFVTAARFFYEHGISSFIIDQRACGKSEGKYVTYGCKETEDCRRWLEFVAKEFGCDTKVFIYGMSMGSTVTVLLGGEKLPENIEYLVADCGFSSVKKQMLYTFSSLKLPAKLFYFLYRSACLCHRIYDPDTVYITQAAGKCSLPVLFIHGDNDSVVSIENLYELYDACGSRNKKYIVTNGVGHVQSFVTSGEVRETIIEGIGQNRR